MGSNGLPGVVVDRYGDTLVAQFSTRSRALKSVIVDTLLAQTGLTRLYERSDASVRSRPAGGNWLARGWRGSSDTGITITEHDWQLSLDVAGGAQNQVLLDQRDSRQKFPPTLAACSSERVELLLHRRLYHGSHEQGALRMSRPSTRRARRLSAPGLTSP
jgi:23S rRNA (cytosine1962-C5)-methyltransferase